MLIRWAFVLGQTFFQTPFQLDSSGETRGMEMLDIVTQCCEQIAHKGDSAELPVAYNTLCLLPGKFDVYLSLIWKNKNILTKHL